MSRAWVIPARAFSVLVAMIMLMFTLGIATPASADPPEDRGNHSSSNDNANSAEAHEKNADRKSQSASSTSSSTATTGGDVTASSKGSSKATATKSNRGGKKKVSASTTTASSHKTSTKNGTYDEEQPVSDADRNPGGANGDQCSDRTDTEKQNFDDGPYCSTRDGRDSANGNDKGKATGRPCAGCVGKADNKNPPGQMPNAEDDGNNGYECDDNNGVGHGKNKTSPGNPAHTGCEPTPTTSDDCPPTHEYYENGCVPPPPECPDGSDKPCDEQECPDGSDLPCDEQECPDGSDFPCDEQECPDGSDLPCDKDEECIGSEANSFCEETPPGSDEEDDRPTVIGGVQDFANPRPPTVAGVEAFAQPPAMAPQAGVLPSTGAASMTSGLLTAGFALLLMGGAVIGLRRQSLARAKR